MVVFKAFLYYYFICTFLFKGIKLKCYIVIELKSVKFKVEYAGKMNLYLSAVDDLMRGGGDNPTDLVYYYAIVVGNHSRICFKRNN